MANNMMYTHLPTPVQLRVATHPDISTEWCGYNPNNYTVPVFLKGIFRDIYMGTITELKATITQPWLKAFIEEDPEAFLGDAFRHLEVGDCFVEKYEDIDEADQDLGPKSGHHLNIITETDKTIEKWQVRISHNRDTYASFFRDYSNYKEFMRLLKGHMEKAVRKALGLIVKAVILADPSDTSFDDKDIARIFGRTRDNTKDPATPGQVTSKAGQKWNEYGKELIQKYWGKSVGVWRNTTWYNPYYWSFDDYYEKTNYGLIHEQPNKAKDKPKRQMQQIYTDAHEVTNDSKKETIKNHHLHRNDSLFALFDVISKSLLIITNEESPEFWLGNDKTARIYSNLSEEERNKIQLHPEVTGTPLVGQGIPAVRQDTAHVSTASSNDGFEVCARPEDLVLILNPEDYDDLEHGIARRGPMDVRRVDLNMLRSKVGEIYSMRGMKPGFAKLIDKRAFKIRSYFQMTDIQVPMEKLTWRYKMFYQFAVTMFQNFAGTTFIPSPHFTASSVFYEKYGLIGQTIEKNA